MMSLDEYYWFNGRNFQGSAPSECIGNEPKYIVQMYNTRVYLSSLRWTSSHICYCLLNKTADCQKKEDPLA